MRSMITVDERCRGATRRRGKMEMSATRKRKRLLRKTKRKTRRA